MNDFDITVKIGATGLTEDEVLDQYSEILSFIQDKLPLDNFSIDVVKRGEFL